jgi:hypothetical protein
MPTEPVAVEEERPLCDGQTGTQGWQTYGHPRRRAKITIYRRRESGRLATRIVTSRPHAGSRGTSEAPAESESDAGPAESAAASTSPRHHVRPRGVPACPWRGTGKVVQPDGRITTIEVSRFEQTKLRSASSPNGRTLRRPSHLANALLATAVGTGVDLGYQGLQCVVWPGQVACYGMAPTFESG